MPSLWGRTHTRDELLRRVGRLEQVAGVGSSRSATGWAGGSCPRVPDGHRIRVRRARRPRLRRRAVRDGGPLACLGGGPGRRRALVLRTRGLGMVPGLGRRDGRHGRPRSHAGPGEDTAEHFHQPHIRATVPYGLHGRVGGLPARLVGYGERWDGDECALWGEGEVLQSAVFGEQLVLRRRIEARVGESRFTIHDEVENIGHSLISHMLLYHCNAGYPGGGRWLGDPRPGRPHDDRLRRSGRRLSTPERAGEGRNRGVLRARARRRARRAPSPSRSSTAGWSWACTRCSASRSSHSTPCGG